MPHGKPAGIPCVQLDDHLRCQLFGRAERPAFCASLRPSDDMCGRDRGDALARLAELETLTRPEVSLLVDPTPLQERLQPRSPSAPVPRHEHEAEAVVGAT